jgi:cyanate permease
MIKLWIKKNESTNSRVDHAFYGWRIVFICFLAQGLSLGFATGSFGPLLASNEQHFGISRTEATAGMALLILAMSGLAPVFGGILHKVSVRTALIWGSLMSAVGYWGLALSHNFGLALVMYFLIGIGVCLMAVLGPVTLVSRWFIADRAKMLSIANLPLLHLAAPFAVSELLSTSGRSIVLGAIGLLFILFLPLLLLIIDYPASVGQQPRGSGMGTAEAKTADQPVAIGHLLKNSTFWLLAVSVGLIAGSGVVFVVHIVPLAMAKRMSLQDASILLSLYSGFGLIGTLLTGWLADRVGARTVLLVTGICIMSAWGGLSFATGPLLYVLAALIGLCVVPVITLNGVALGELVGPASISRAMGFSYVIQLPFIFSLAPVVGYLFDHTGGYTVSILLIVGMLAAACLFLLLTTITIRKHKRSSDMLTAS